MLDSLGALCWSTEYELWPRFVTCLASPGVDANWQDALGAASSRSLRFWDAEVQLLQWRSSDASQHSVSHGNGKYRQTFVLCTCTILDASSWFLHMMLTASYSSVAGLRPSSNSSSKHKRCKHEHKLWPAGTLQAEYLRHPATICNILWPSVTTEKEEMTI